MTGQSEPTPRKTVSHEGFQKSSQISNSSSNSGGSAGIPATGSPSSTSDSATKGISGANNSNAGVSAFSYLKARLFGSSADPSITTPSSKESHLKKGNDMNKGSPHELPYGNSGTINSGLNIQVKDTSHNQNGDLHTTGSPPTSPTIQTSPSNHRFFSRTLPGRRQPQSESQLVPGKHIVLPPINSTVVTTPGEIPPPSASSNGVITSKSAYGIQDRSSTLSQSIAQKHLSTGSLIFHEGYLNKKVELHSGEIGHGWKVYRVALKSSKLYFYKPSMVEDRPKFQDPKDHNQHRRQYLSPNHSYHDHQGHHHPQHSSSSGIISPRLSITNECGMVLSAFNFESSTRTLLFEGNAKSINQGGQTFAPPVTKYVYGECFTEIDRLTMQFKKHVALLLFEDNIVICKRKWMRYASTKVKDAIKFNSNNHEKGDSQDAAPSKRQGSMSGISYKSGDSRGSDVEYRSRTSFDHSEKQRGYFTKWKHEATYPITQVEALDMASPVPSSSATFYPFAAPATTALGSMSSIGRNPRDPETSSIYTNAPASAHNTHQTTSTLELVITSFIDGKEYTQRLLYLPPSQEVRHQWYSKFNRVKELHQSRSYPKSNGRGSVEALALRDTLSPRSARPNQSTTSLHSPTSPKFHAESGNFVLNSGKMDRIRAFCETSRHPDLTTRLDESTGIEKLVGASVNGLIHELIFSNVVKSDIDLITLIASTYQLFTTVPLILKELKRNVNIQPTSAENSESSATTTRRVEDLVREMTKRLCAPSADMNALEQLRTFTIDILQEKLNSTAAVDLLNDIDVALLKILTSDDIPELNHTSIATSKDAPVDLSNVLITGLTPALFLKLDPLYFAEQVLRYHIDQLRSIGEISDLVSNPVFFMRQFPTVGKIQPQQSPLVFSMYSPHFLTVLITHHILIATQSAQSTSRRPKLLVHWIRTAQHSRTIGDMAGFIAIASGICSPGVVRLQETWKQVPRDLQLEVAQSWVPMLIELRMITEDLQELAVTSFNLSGSTNNVIDLSLDGTQPTISCVSNIKQSIDHLDRTMPSFLQSNPVPILNIEKLEHICTILQKATCSIPENLQCTNTTFTSLANNHIQQYFSHLASISQTLHDQYHSSELSNDAFESSLACEPHFNGQYLDYHYKNRKMTGSFIPLIFPEVIPEKRLFAQPLLLSLESTGNANRKNSFDETQSSQTSTSRVSFLKQASEFQSSAVSVLGEWNDPLATHHGTTQSNLTGTSSFPVSRMRTYSFPPSRSAARDADPNSQMVNMINPHLVAVACGCLSDTDDSESNEILMAMRGISGIGYHAITVGHGRLVLKAKEDSIATLVKDLTLEGDSKVDSDLQRPSINWNNNGTPGSNRSSCSIINAPRLVMVKAGTLEGLIHVAILGLEDQNGKFFDEKGCRQLALDQMSFRKAFFATFRSFCTVGRLLDQLFAMFAFPQGADLKSTPSPTAMDIFPDAKRASSSAQKVESGSHDSSGHDIKRIMAVQTSVLNAIEHWLGSHTGDFLDDLTFKSKLSETLKSMSTHLVSQSQQLGDAFASESQIIMDRLLQVERFVVKQLMKPPNATCLNSGTIEAFFTSHHSLPPQLDDLWTVDQILDSLNTAVWAHFLTVREQEWFVLFEVLESQSADPLGWYLPKAHTATADEDIVITGIHDTLYTIRRNGAPGTHWNGERLLNSLPLCLQNLCKLHHVIRGWVITQVASPNISYNVRLDRIQKMLSVILQSRRAMSQFGDETTSEAMGSKGPSTIGIPSFVENAVVSALVSPESRAYTRVWIEVASGRTNSVETLEDVLVLHREREKLSQGSSIQTASQELAPAIGWLIERMLETCCYVRDMSYESPLLVNFDKRRYIYDLIQTYTKKQDHLRNEIKTPTPLSSWLASNIPKSSRSVKIFSRLVAFQQEKVKRDQKEFEKLEKQIKDTQGRIQKAQQEQAKSLEKQIKLEQNRSRVKNQLLKSTLMRAMRPISLAITNSWSSATTTVSNATAIGSAVSGRLMGGTAANGSVEALESANQHGLYMHQTNIQPRVHSMVGSVHSSSGPKPVLVINLINSTCSVAYTYTKRDYVFKIVTEEGGQSLLQGVDYEDMLRWIKILNEAAAEATAKRRTLLDSDENKTMSVEELPAVVENERKGRNSVFGVELRHLMSDGGIPLIVEKCIAEIEKRGLEEVGIYRVPGAVSSINKLRLRFNSGSENVDLGGDEWKDINVVAGALKQFLRELPDSVMTSSLYDSLIAASALEDYDERLMTMKDLIRTLPSPNYLLLKRVIEHLERVTDFEEVNHMYATNLAIVFGPTLLRPGGTSANSFATSMKNLGHQQNIVRNLILQYHWLFDVEDEEGGVEVEVEVEVEEDEEEDEEELGEFPDITEDSEEDVYEDEEVVGGNDDDDILVLAASQPTSAVIDTKDADKANDKSVKHQHRKTIVFG
ncbi:rho GTPase-activating protein [Entomortierella beljakovae]|nr:rho GTPase-activating protein [Entomortierella beljakovae]